jgi:hypothetical protein
MRSCRRARLRPYSHRQTRPHTRRRSRTRARYEGLLTQFSTFAGRRLSLSPRAEVGPTSGGTNDLARVAGISCVTGLVFNAVSTRIFLHPSLCVVSGMRTTPARRHWPPLTHRGHFCAGLITGLPPIVWIANASTLFGQLLASLFRHDMTEAWVGGSEPSEVRVLGPCVLPLSEFRPFRTLLGAMTATVERVVLSESASALPPRRSNPGGFPHLGRPLDAHRTQAPRRQIEQRMSLAPKQFDPDYFRPPKFFEAFYALKFIGDDVIAIMRSQPIVERRLSPRPGNFDMLLEANAVGFGRKTYIAIHGLRPEPDPVDHATGRKLDGHKVLLSATCRHNMQLTQFSTWVPSRAIWRSRM